MRYVSVQKIIVNIECLTAKSVVESGNAEAVTYGDCDELVSKLIELANHTALNLSYSDHRNKMTADFVFFDDASKLVLDQFVSV